MNNERPSGAVDQAAFETVIRENLSPEGVAALVMALQPATSMRATTPEGEQALRQVLWFHNTLLDMIGVETFNRTADVTEADCQRPGSDRRMARQRYRGESIVAALNVVIYQCDGWRAFVAPTGKSQAAEVELAGEQKLAECQRKQLSEMA